jgi:hypothetical protein
MVDRSLSAPRRCNAIKICLAIWTLTLDGLAMGKEPRLQIICSARLAGPAGQRNVTGCGFICRMHTCSGEQFVQKPCESGA